LLFSCGPGREDYCKVAAAAPEALRLLIGVHTLGRCCDGTHDACEIHRFLEKLGLDKVTTDSI
jgi:hypothetical protein